MAPGELRAADWLGACRRAADGVRSALARYPTRDERGVTSGRGAGGDEALVIDRAAEDAVLAELEGLGVPLTVISEERGRVEIRGGGPPFAVVDPVDGSLNAKRGLPSASVSIALTSGPTLAELELGYVATLDEAEREWWAARGEGAHASRERLELLAPDELELLGIETARPELVAEAAPALASCGARRVRALGSVAVTLCLVAEGRLDAMVSLRAVRSVDVAAGALLVREAGGALAFPEAGEAASIELSDRYRVLAARDPELLERLLDAFGRG